MSEDFQDSLRTEVHDDATESSLAALDAEEASPAHAVAVALDVVEDAVRAQAIARQRYRDANSAYYAARTALAAALDAEARS